MSPSDTYNKTDRSGRWCVLHWRRGSWHMVYIDMWAECTKAISNFRTANVEPTDYRIERYDPSAGKL